jgi:hypothetical protein
VQLARLGLWPIDVIVQIRHSERGCVLRVPTNAGPVYFKALPAFFAHEVALTDLLARLYPTNTVQTLAADPHQHWLLLRDYNGRILDDVAEIGHWEEAARRYAQIQVDCISQVAPLMELGCPDRRLNRIAAQLDPLLAETDTMTLPGRPGGLTPTEVERLRSHAPFLKEWLADLAGYGLPETLEHGDLWGQNIAVTDAGPVYFDWSDSGIAHPFFLMLTWLTDFAITFPDIPAAYQRVRDAYLEPWSDYASANQLVVAFDLAQRVASVYYALIQRDVRAQMEAQWEMELGVPQCLRRLWGGDVERLLSC